MLPLFICSFYFWSNLSFADMQTCCLSFPKGPLKGHRVTSYRHWGTKIIQGNIMWVSNFHMDMYGNVLKFWCYDPNLCSPGQGGFYRFPSVHHFLTHSCLLFTEFSSACNWKQASQSPVLFLWSHFLWSKLFFFFIFLFFKFFYFHGGRKKGKITTGIWGNGL